MKFPASFRISYLGRALSPLDRASLFLATAGGAGDFPFAPGTVGSIVALALFYPLSFLAPLWQAVGIVAVTLLGTWTAGRVGRWSKVDDDSRIVIDEVAGMWITLWAFPFDPWIWLAGFVIFRVLDVVKVFPANYCDEELHGGRGVMLDDVVSGIYAHALLRLVLQLTHLA